MKCHTFVLCEKYEINIEPTLAYSIGATDLDLPGDYVKSLHSFKDNSMSSINIRYKNLNKLYF